MDKEFYKRCIEIEIYKSYLLDNAYKKRIYCEIPAKLKKTLSAGGQQ